MTVIVLDLSFPHKKRRKLVTDSVTRAAVCCRPEGHIYRYCYFDGTTAEDAHVGVCSYHPAVDNIKGILRAFVYLGVDGIADKV